MGHPNPVARRSQGSSLRSDSGLRVAIAGARRAQQGTGPFLALHARAVGAEVCGLATRRPETAAAAASWLAERDLTAPAFADVDEMLRRTEPDVLIISTPAGSHLPWIRAALQRGVHVLCEKPLLASPSEPAVADAEPLADDFRQAGLLLRESCQWPHCLSIVPQLYPEWEPARVEHFAMKLSPPQRGRARLVEVLSHPLSVLQALMDASLAGDTPESGDMSVPGSPISHRGPPQLEAVSLEEDSPEASTAIARFRYTTATRTIACEVTMVDSGEFPRPAEMSFDGRLCRRGVREPGYQIVFDRGPSGSSLAADAVAIEDPMLQLVRDFLIEVDAVRQGKPATIDPHLVLRQQALEQVLAAYEC